MNTMDKIVFCQEFFDELAKKLKAYNYIVVPSCDNDISRYLVLAGSENQITYETKPKYSFRISDHWNWKAALYKCPNPNYIQCYNVDLLQNPRYVTNSPTNAICVAATMNGYNYHTVYGDLGFDPRKGGCRWQHSSADYVIAQLKAQVLCDIFKEMGKAYARNGRLVMAPDGTQYDMSEQNRYSDVLNYLKVG